MKKSSIFILPIIPLMIISLYFILTTSNYVRFWADDFCTAAALQQYGFWSALYHSWMTWSGRYSYNFFIYFFLIFGKLMVSFVPLIVFSLLVTSLWPFIYKTFTPKGKYFSLFISLLIIILILINTPNIIQSFYWYGGTLIYALPFVFFNLFLSLITGNDSEILKRYPNFIFIFNFFLMFIAGGFSETFAAMQLVFLTFVLMINYFIACSGRKRLVYMIIAGILGLFISLGVMLISPGTALRSSTLSKPDSLRFIINSTFDNTALFLINLIANKTLIYTVILIFSLVFYFSNKVKNIVKLSLSLPKTFSLVIFAVMSAILSTAAIYAVAYYSMAYHPPERALFSAIYIIIFTIIFISVIISRYLFRLVSGRYRKILDLMFFFIFTASLLLLSRDTYRRWKFLRNDLKTYADAWDIQSEIIKRQAAENGEIIIKYIPPVGRLDGFKENKAWVSSCAAGYYGVKKYTLE